MKGLILMKKLKQVSTITLISSLALFLSGCVQRTKSGKPYGIIYDTLAVPTQHVMNALAQFIGGRDGYGWAIILVTFIVRLILLPLMINQSRKATIQQEKMAFIQPQMKVLQDRNKNASSPEEKNAVSQEMMALYKDNGVSMTGGIGCLPILIQLPVFAALYAAIQYSPELHTNVNSHLFLGIINLATSKTSLILAALSFAMYLLQGWLGTIGIPEAQKKTMQSMMIVSPLMIFFFTFSAPGGLGLYFFVGGIFACIQTLIINFYRPRIKASIQAEMKKNPPKIVEPTGPVDLNNVETTSDEPTEIAPETDSKPVESNPSNHDNTSNDHRRNAGKQRHHKD